MQKLSYVLCRSRVRVAGGNTIVDVIKQPGNCGWLCSSSSHDECGRGVCAPCLSIFCAHLLGKLGVASSEGRCNLSKLTYSPHLILFTSRLTGVGTQVIRGESVDPGTGTPTLMLAVAGWG